MIDARVEWPLIESVAGEYGVDPVFVLAIRYAENGPAGCEFGVRSIAAQGYEAQLERTCESVARSLARWPHGAHELARGVRGQVRVRYAPAWIEFFGARWAPLDDLADAGGLNAHWIHNVLRVYRRLLAAGPSYPDAA